MSKVAKASIAATGIAALSFVWGTASVIGHDRDVRREAAEAVLDMMDTNNFRQTFEIEANGVTYRAQATPGIVQASESNPYIGLGNPAYECWDLRMRVVEGEDEEPTLSGFWGSNVTETVYRDAGRNSGSCHPVLIGQEVNAPDTAAPAAPGE